MTLNLARRPFANLRPLRRLAIGLWVLGGVASLVSLWLFFAYASGSAEKRRELARLENSSNGESARISGLEVELGRADLESQNREIEYLNDRIAERTFAWSALFDDLADVLPWNVRVLSLSPLSVMPNRRAGVAAAAPAPGTFGLHLVGTASDGEALLVFVDRLFAHPSFAEPNLEQERRQNGEELQFSLTVTYRPRSAAAPSLILPTASGAPGVTGAGVAASAGAAPSFGPGSVAAPSPASGGTPVPSALPGVAVADAGAPPTAERPDPGASPAAPSPKPEAPRGWEGVQTAWATTAPLPAPPAGMTETLEPAGTAPAPLPLAPAYSSTAGIR